MLHFQSFDLTYASFFFFFNFFCEMLFDTTQNVNAVNDERREGDLFDKFGSYSSTLDSIIYISVVSIYYYIYISSCN